MSYDYTLKKILNPPHRRNPTFLYTASCEASGPRLRPVVWPPRNNSTSKLQQPPAFPEFEPYPPAHTPATSHHPPRHSRRPRPRPPETEPKKKEKTEEQNEKEQRSARSLNTLKMRNSQPARSSSTELANLAPRNESKPYATPETRHVRYQSRYDTE